MRIKNKLFPYPIVQEKNGVYKTAKYTASVTYQIIEGRCELSFHARINVPEIKALIDKGKAVYAFHLECGRTYFRRMVVSQNETCNITLDGKKIDRVLEICPMIIATQSVSHFVCKDLSDVYAGEELSFARGDILAIGTHESVTIIKDKDALKKLTAMFYVDPYPDGMDEKFLSIQPGDKQVGILVTQNDAARFSQCKDDPKRRNTFYAALYLPALIATVDLMKSKDGDEHSGDLWYISLSEKGKEKGIGGVEDWGNRSSLEIAQILFDYPITKYLKELLTPKEDETK